MSDADDMFRNWVTDPEVSRSWGGEPYKDIEETKVYLADCIAKEYSNPKTNNWIIVIKKDEQAIGYIYLNAIDEAVASYKQPCK